MYSATESRSVSITPPRPPDASHVVLTRTYAGPFVCHELSAQNVQVQDAVIYRVPGMQRSTLARVHLRTRIDLLTLGNLPPSNHHGVCNARTRADVDA